MPFLLQAVCSFCVYGSFRVLCRGHARPFWEGLWGARFLVLLGLRTSLDVGGFDGPATIPLPYVDRLACAWWAREWVAGAHACGEPCLWRSCCLTAACGCVRRCCGWLGLGHALCMCDVTWPAPHAVCCVVPGVSLMQADSAAWSMQAVWQPDVPRCAGCVHLYVLSVLCVTSAACFGHLSGAQVVEERGTPVL